ncbi:unnamed protein product, partial [Allacma fusca]
AFIDSEAMDTKRPSVMGPANIYEVPENMTLFKGSYGIITHTNDEEADPGVRFFDKIESQQINNKQTQKPRFKETMAESKRCGLTLEEGTRVTVQNAVGYAVAGRGDAKGAVFGGTVFADNVVASVVSKDARGKNLVGAEVGKQGTVVAKNFTCCVTAGRNNVTNYS